MGFPPAANYSLQTAWPGRGSSSTEHAPLSSAACAITFAAENANRLAAGDKPLGVVDPFE